MAKKGITFEEAVAKAKRRNPKYNACIEHPNAWSFYLDDGEIRVGGGDSGIIIMKDDGRILLGYEYYMSDIGESEIIQQMSI